jgi:hypothetical protein
MRYSVLEATKLFDAVRAKMAGQEDDVKAFLSAVLDTEGVYEGPAPAVRDEEDDA